MSDTESPQNLETAMKSPIVHPSRPPVVRAFADVAEQIGLSPAALAGAIARGEIELQIIKFGRRRFIRSADLAGFLSSKPNKVTT